MFRENLGVEPNLEIRFFVFNASQQLRRQVIQFNRVNPSSSKNKETSQKIVNYTVRIR